jgi:uncharacterized protein (DUF1778 family)
MSSAATLKKVQRSERLEARVSTDLKRLFERAAELRGITLTDFVISTVHDAAIRTVQEHETLQLNQAATRAVVDALLNPPAPNSRLRAALRNYQKLFCDK